MELLDCSEPARARKAGAETLILTRPGKLKIQLTGPGERILFNDNPPSGKKWELLVRIDVLETDE